MKKKKTIAKISTALYELYVIYYSQIAENYET